jgi:hypothetical protein
MPWYLIPGNALSEPVAARQALLIPAFRAAKCDESVTDALGI